MYLLTCSDIYMLIYPTYFLHAGYEAGTVPGTQGVQG